MGKFNYLIFTNALSLEQPESRFYNKFTAV